MVSRASRSRHLHPGMSHIDRALEDRPTRREDAPIEFGEIAEFELALKHTLAEYSSNSGSS